jgi:cbb3-type cytochrome oxidase subunit 3
MILILKILGFILIAIFIFLIGYIVGVVKTEVKKNVNYINEVKRTFIEFNKEITKLGKWVKSIENKSKIK